MGNEGVRKQYSNANNLSTRINLHAKYSVNKQGFGNWVFEQYDLKPGMRILELGCGIGSVWPDKLPVLPEDCELILSDFSEGMLQAAKKRVGEHAQLSYRCIDIMEIPYGDCSFDAVIANMMLYHVPDLHAALKEVRRVLKPGGAFYCATYGENGIMCWLNEALCELRPDIRMNTAFTLQNGDWFLKMCFSSVRKLRYDDAFEITSTDDLVDYVYSMTAMANLERVDREKVYRLLDSRKQDGMIRIPKEYGMFICT